MLPEGWQDIQRLLIIPPIDAEEEPLFPALRLLRLALPNAEIVALVAANTQPFVTFFPSIDEILAHPTLRLKADRVLSREKNQIKDLIAVLQQRCFDAAIVFTLPQQSPYPLAYLCYLAGIPHRLGQSLEFGGSVLSHCVKPLSVASLAEHHLLMLKSAGFDGMSEQELSFAHHLASSQREKSLVQHPKEVK